MNPGKELVVDVLPHEGAPTAEAAVARAQRARAGYEGTVERIAGRKVTQCVISRDTLACTIESAGILCIRATTHGLEFSLAPEMAYSRDANAQQWPITMRFRSSGRVVQLDGEEFRRFVVDREITDLWYSAPILVLYLSHGGKVTLTQVFESASKLPLLYWDCDG